MKIDRSYGNYEKESYKPTPTVDAPTVKAPTVKAAQSTVEPATIKLSDTAQKIRQTHPAETKNAEKIAAIKKAIQEGTYQVSAKEIADSMWQEMKEK